MQRRVSLRYLKKLVKSDTSVEICIATNVATSSAKLSSGAVAETGVVRIIKRK